MFHYSHEVLAAKSGLSLKNRYHKLMQPFRKTSIDKRALSFIGLALWNKNIAYYFYYYYYHYYYYLLLI